MYTKLKNEGRVHPKPDGSKELAGATVRSVHAVIHEAMEMAVSQRIIIRNPTVGTVLPKVVPKPINPFNTEQLDKFLSVIQNEPEWHDLFYMEVTTGLRRGEVCGLKWSDFDADSGSIRRKKMGKGGHGVSGHTHSQSQLDNYANQNNPNNEAFWANHDNHSDQCNPNNDEYWHSREKDDDKN